MSAHAPFWLCLLPACSQDSTKSRHGAVKCPKACLKRMPKTRAVISSKQHMAQACPVKPPLGFVCSHSPACFGILSDSPGPEGISPVFATKSVQSRANSVHSPSPVPKSLSTVFLQQWMSSITQQLRKVILSAQIFIRGAYGKCLHS